MVVIVVEGDIQTLEHASKLVKKKVPIIVVKGTGKAADFIVSCLEQYVKLMHVDTYFTQQYNLKPIRFSFGFLWAPIVLHL